MSGNSQPAKGAPRKKKKKRLSKKAKRIMIVIFAAVLLLAALFCAVFFGVFRVRDFVVKGELPYSPQEMISESGIPLGKNLFMADTAGAAEKIASSLPYADEVTVTKKLPSTIVIHARTANKTYAVMMNGGAYAITNEKLKVLEIGASIPDGAMIVEGYTGSGVNALGEELPFGNGMDSESIIEALSSISQAVTESGMKGIEMINIENPDSIYILYEGRIIIRLGNTSDVLKKLSLAQKSIEEENKLSSSQYGEMNVSTVGKASFLPKDYKNMPELVEYMEGKEAAAQAAENEAGAESGEETGEEENGETADEESNDEDSGYGGDYDADNNEE